jgi:hypothetical protein
MAYDRRSDQRGGGRPPGRGGRPPGPRPPRRDFDRPPREFDRPPRDFDRPQREFDRRPGDRSTSGPTRPGRSFDEPGMSIRLDPRRLAALKLLASEAGVRPGELVTHWVEERLDAARAGGAPGAGAAPTAGGPQLAALNARMDAIVARLDAIEASGTAAPAPSATVTEEAPAEAPVRRRGRPPKARAEATRPKAARAAGRKSPGGKRVPLHEEIAAVIGERGPQTAAELATAIGERGRYAAPRSARPLDAATINSRVSNPVYRARFTRRDGRIGLADAG